MRGICLLTTFQLNSCGYRLTVSARHKPCSSRKGSRIPKNAT
ncbi:hypothetical protein GCK32_019219, partial [Trichostrongylus colubriformis]